MIKLLLLSLLLVGCEPNPVKRDEYNLDLKDLKEEIRDLKYKICKLENVPNNLDIGDRLYYFKENRVFIKTEEGTYTFRGMDWSGYEKVRHFKTVQEALNYAKLYYITFNCRERYEENKL